MMSGAGDAASTRSFAPWVYLRGMLQENNERKARHTP
jgi:hypothetical protein